MTDGYDIPVGNLRESEKRGILLASAAAMFVSWIFIYGWGANTGRDSGYQKGFVAGQMAVMEHLKRGEPLQVGNEVFIFGDPAVAKKRYPGYFKKLTVTPKLR